jgi:hypothetical protein
MILIMFIGHQNQNRSCVRSVYFLFSINLPDPARYQLRRNSYTPQYNLSDKPFGDESGFNFFSNGEQKGE